MQRDKKVLAFVGMPGSGKTSCVDYVKAKGVPFTYAGGVVVNEVKKRGLEVNEKNEKFVANDLRLKEGKDIIAKRMIEEVNELFKQGHNRVIIDGLYSWTEYKKYEEAFGVSLTVISIAAPRNTRHDRLANRPVRPLNKQDANERDYREIEDLEKGGPIANADYTIVNDGAIDDLIYKLDSVIKEVGF